MNKVLVIITIGMCCLISCSSDYSETHSAVSESRIVEVGYRIIDGVVYRIMKVDSHLYFCNGDKGGVVHMESCPCRTGTK